MSESFEPIFNGRRSAAKCISENPSPPPLYRTRDRRYQAVAFVQGHVAGMVDVIALSLVILAVPFFLMLVAVITLDVVEPRSLCSPRRCCC